MSCAGLLAVGQLMASLQLFELFDAAGYQANIIKYCDQQRIKYAIRPG